VAKQTTVRLPDELADDAAAVARVQGSSVNQLIIDSRLPQDIVAPGRDSVRPRAHASVIASERADA
jgi:hypothetical protein